MKKGIIIVLILALLALIFAMKGREKEEGLEIENESESQVETQETENKVVKPSTTENTTQTSDQNTQSGPKTFTLAEVAKHAVENDCYSAINGKIYDLGAWVNKHPGGDKNILRICGKDGSSAFNGQHGGEGKPEQILAGFEIGILVK